MTYLIWFRRDNFIILFFTIVFVFLLFYQFIINLFISFLFNFFRMFKRKVTQDSSPFSFYIFILLSLLMLLFKSSPCNCPAQGHFCPESFLSHNLAGHYLQSCPINDCLRHHCPREQHCSRSHTVPNQKPQFSFSLTNPESNT